GDADVDEVDVGLLAQDAGDVVLEAETQPYERLAEELTLLLRLQRLCELFVRDQALAQQQGAEVRAGLVLEEGVVQACRPHVSAGIGILAAGLEGETGVPPRCLRPGAR